MQGVNCVAVGEIGLDHVGAMQDKGCDQQTEVCSRGCGLAREVGSGHSLQRNSKHGEFLWIMKGNLQTDQMVYCHHFNET